MDPRIRALIDGVRASHGPIWITQLHGNTDKVEAFCYGCKGLVFDCPALKAADELEEEDAKAGEESGSD